MTALSTPFVPFDTNQGQRNLDTATLVTLLQGATLNSILKPTNNGTVAATGTVQGNSTVLAGGDSYLSGATYTLPGNYTGGDIRVFNVSGNATTVFASAGNGTVNGGSANGNISVAAASAATFVQRSAGAFYTIPTVPS